MLDRPEVHDELLMRLQESGTAAPSGTHGHSRDALRYAITNHRRRREDVAMLVAAVAHIGAELVVAGADTDAHTASPTE